MTTPDPLTPCPQHDHAVMDRALKTLRQHQNQRAVPPLMLLLNLLANSVWHEEHNGEQVVPKSLREAAVHVAAAIERQET